MIDQIAEIAVQECKLSFDRPVLAAISGGPDSLCLLDILRQLGYPLILAYLDHKIRAEAAAEAHTLANLASKLGLPICLGEADTIQYANEYRLSVEEAARILRYQFLFLQAEKYRAQAVATGHTADDQVETVLMHLLRGSGLDGLRGMAYRSLPNLWSKTIPLVRPLLGVWRRDILNYLDLRNLMPFEDATNRETLYFRNRIRHELIPVLEGYNPGIRSHLWQTALIVQADLAVIEQVVAEAWSDCLQENTRDWCAFDLAAISSKPEAIIRHILRRAACDLKPALRDIDFDALQRGCRFIHKPPVSQQCDWIGGLRLRIQDDILWITGWETTLPNEKPTVWPQVTSDQSLLLTIPGELALANGWYFQAEVVSDLSSALRQAEYNTDPFQAWINASELADGLQVRQRKPGDALSPLGMNGQFVKVSDLMINKKIPRPARSGWPVVVVGNRIVWLPGLCLAEPFKLTKDIQSVVRLVCHLKI